MKNQNLDLEHKDIVLAKKDILDFCDRIVKKWEEDETKDINDIFAVNMFKLNTYWTNDESISAIWKEVLQWSFELVYKNIISDVLEKERMEKLGMVKKTEPAVKNTEPTVKNTNTAFQWF